MNRFKISLEEKIYYVSGYLVCNGNLFLHLVDVTKEPFKGNVVCVNDHFEILHRFNEVKATGIWTNNESLIIESSGYQFYYNPTNFVNETSEWSK
jgi:hypothetical protein